jgi:hypothetical protein
MKNKNPLYVVKGKTVLEANGLFDLVIKKFNLGPVMNVLSAIFKLILAQVTTYSSFVVAKKYLDEVLTRVIALIEKMQSKFA